MAQSRFTEEQIAYERRALRIAAMSRSAFSYKTEARDCSAIRLRMREITQTRIHYGCERVLVMLRRERWRDKRKRMHRIYKEEGLSLSIVGRVAVAAAVEDSRSKWRQRPTPCRDGLCE
ncbi:hypothetical protein [Xanthomonas vasicola]|uniref:hypothetical protein n=1 Tax=Xanthomonas vasicola TaxID=56459 RepID=UPI000ADF4B36|nr:hypothetical protein [Xanthomonas vasicola]